MSTCKKIYEYPHCTVYGVRANCFARSWSGRCRAFLAKRPCTSRFCAFGMDIDRDFNDTGQPVRLRSSGGEAGSDSRKPCHSDAHIGGPSVHRFMHMNAGDSRTRANEPKTKAKSNPTERRCRTLPSYGSPCVKQCCVCSGSSR